MDNDLNPSSEDDAKDKPAEAVAATDDVAPAEAVTSAYGATTDVIEDESLGSWQFGLGAMFSLTAACAVYFLFERLTNGRFGLMALGAAGLTLFAALPALWIALWIARGVAEAREPLSTILLMLGIAGGVLAVLGMSFGF